MEKRDPELAQATALLNVQFLSINSIPARSSVPIASGIPIAPTSEHGVPLHERGTAADQAQQALAF